MDQRWVILQHTLAKGSLEGLHFDLLLEDVENCRTWRLPSIPVLGGPLVEAIPTSPHRLYWLGTEESFVSGDRGWAKRVLNGTFDGPLPEQKHALISIDINSISLSGRLQLGRNYCQISFSSKYDFI